MRTRLKVVGVAGAIAMGACSGGGVDASLENDLARAQSLRADLASASASARGVVSDLEVPPVATLHTSRAGSRAGGNALRSPAKAGTAAVVAADVQKDETQPPVAEQAVGDIPVPSPVLAVSETMTKAGGATTDIVIPSPRPRPVEPVSGGEGLGMAGRTSGSEDAGPEPRGGILRGGVRVHDPCAVHGPNRGPIMLPNGTTGLPAGTVRTGGGTLINNRVPTRGAGREPMRTNPTFPRGGIR